MTKLAKKGKKVKLIEDSGEVAPGQIANEAIEAVH